MFDQPEQDVPQEITVTAADQEAIERVYNFSTCWFSISYFYMFQTFL